MKNTKRFLGLFLALALILSGTMLPGDMTVEATDTDNTMTWNGPIISGLGSDPSICKGADGGYYLVTSSFSMHPGIPVYYSENLVDWELVSYAGMKQNINPGMLGFGRDGFYAPSIREHNGTYYMIVQDFSAFGTILTSSTNPRNPDSWSEPIKVSYVGGGYIYIDQDLFFDEETGICWLTAKNVMSNCVESFKFDVTTGTATDGRAMWNGLNGGDVEAPHIYRIGDYYYQSVAEGGTDSGFHMQNIARLPVSIGLENAVSEDWEALKFNVNAPTANANNGELLKYIQENNLENKDGTLPCNPIISSKPDNEINNTGHADLVQDDNGNWWAIFLGIRSTTLPNLGRETFLAPITWKDGWPIVNNGEEITMEMSGPKVGEAHDFAVNGWDEFDTEEFDLNWNYVYTPELPADDANADVSLAARKGYLTLKTNGAVRPWGSTSDNGTKLSAYLGRRQTSKEMAFTTKLDFMPENDGEKAGISLIGSAVDTNVLPPSGYTEFMVRRVNGKTEIYLGMNPGRDGENFQEVSAPVESGTVYLRVLCADECYQFQYSVDGKEYATLKKAKCDEVILFPGFSGVFVGLWASSGIQDIDTDTPAYFDWVDYVTDKDAMDFTDVKADDWFYDAVYYNYRKKIMTGLNDSSFGPNDALARAQFAVILHRMNGEPEMGYKKTFPDVEDGIWYTDAILWANSIKVVNGYTDTGLFGPADYINREQIATMMYRYADYKKYDIEKKADFSKFADASLVNSFAENAMKWAVGTGIIKGKYNETVIDPQGNATRAECATIIQRFLELYK